MFNYTSAVPTDTLVASHLICGGLTISIVTGYEAKSEKKWASNHHSRGLSYSAVPGLAIYTIVILAFIFRLLQLGMQSLWYDEGFSVYLSQQDLSTITSITAADIHPPFYYYLLHFWMLAVGSSEFSVRYFSLLWGVLTIPVLVGFARRAVSFTQSGAEETGSKPTPVWSLIALLSGLLAAINPAFVWYSQEARMYSLLLFLTVLGSYCFLRLLSKSSDEESPSRWIWAVILVFANIMAIYTHFYAFFVMGGQLAFLGVWWLFDIRRRLKRASVLLLLFMLASLSYLPWAGFAANRLEADASYYQGILEPNIVLSQTFDLFITGYSSDENSLSQTAIPVMVLAVIGLMLLVSTVGREKNWRQQILPGLYLVLYFVLPFLLLYAVSYNRPKFHPRYLLIALPPFLILASAAGPWLYHKLKPKSFPVIRWLVLLVPFLIPVLISLQSLQGVYFNNKYFRDDWRGVAQFLSRQVTDNDAVILISGHSFPVFAYYYKKDNWTPIPDELTLSTEDTLNYNVANSLNELSEGKNSIWVVRWQDNVVDPNGFLQRQLDDNAHKLEVSQKFRGIEVDHYSLTPGTQFKAEPNVQRTSNINYEGKLKLLGFDTKSSGADEKDPSLHAASGSSIALTLYWQALSKLDEDYSVSLRLRDSENHFWGRVDRRPTNYYYPTQRWKVGEIVFGDYELPVLPGTPPGDYVVEAEIYKHDSAQNEGLSVLNEFGAPVGNSGTLARFRIDPPDTPPSIDSLNIQNPVNKQFQGLELLGYQEIDMKQLLQGSSFPLVLFWRSDEKIDGDLTLQVDLVADDGTVVGSSQFQPGKKEYPTSQWKNGEVISGQYDVRVPAAAKPGETTVRVSVLNGETSVGDGVSLQKVLIEERPRSTSAPKTIQNPLDVTFGNAVKLVGYDIEPQTRKLKPGEIVKLTLYWEAQKDISTGLVVFNHLLDSAGRVAAQHDGVPNDGASPTTSWLEGEVVADTHKIQVKPDAPPGVLTIETGVYEPVSGIRWHTSSGDDRITLGEVRVE